MLFAMTFEYFFLHISLVHLSLNILSSTVPTNHPNSIDSALRRFSKFESEFNIGVSKEVQRLEIFHIHTFVEAMSRVTL
jgi:SpoVK/Ycf46/Vps4 family AAA+-type ATPase